MGCVQQAVLEFDEEVAAPWRPRLAAAPVPAGGGGLPSAVPGASARPARHSRSTPSRVGACRPHVSVASATAARPAAAAITPALPVAHRSAASGPRCAAASRRGSRAVAHRESARLRLTHRGRRLAVVLALAAGVALGAWLGPLLSGGTGGDLRLAGQSSVTVESGDTLWSIASSVAGTSDVRAVIDHIRRINGLRTADLVPGQVLQLP